jgi:hypothetical protein
MLKKQALSLLFTAVATAQDATTLIYEYSNESTLELLAQTILLNLESSADQITTESI